jgi:hypothetical protein
MPAGARGLHKAVLYGFFSAQTKRLETKPPETKRPGTKRLWTKHPWGQNVRGDKTSVGTKHPWEKKSIGQNVRGDKRSVGQNVRWTKRLAEKMSVRTKRPWGQNVRGQNIRLGQIYQGLARQFSLIKSIEHEGKIRLYTHSLFGFCFLRFFIFIKTVYILTMTLLRCTILSEQNKILKKNVLFKLLTNF